MSDKLDRVVDAIIKKTEDGLLDWERIDGGYCKRNSFYRRYAEDNGLELDGINTYMASYDGGYIFFTNQSQFGYREIAIQPNKGADITTLSTGSANSTPKLSELESIIKEELDNPDDFLDSLLR